MANKTNITLEGDRAVKIERDFDAPLDKVWRAYTEPELYIQWMGPNGLKARVDAWEMKEGGAYGYTHTDPSGMEFSFRGWRASVVPKESIVETFEWLGLPGHVSLNTARFTDLGNGRTHVAATAVFQTPADRDGMVQNGMDRGILEGNDRLEALLATLS